MSKQPIPSPPGDRPVRAAPPPAPGWRHWLWPVALGLMVVLWLFLPAIHASSTVTLSYSQFIADTGAHKIKTVTFASSTGNTPASGTLASGKSYTTIIPGQPSAALNQQLTAGGVQITASAPGSGFGTELLSWLILLLPLLLRVLSVPADGPRRRRARWAESLVWAGPGRRSSTLSGHRPSSPMWPGMRAPRLRSPR